jgi:hypothetical protein
LVIAAGTTERKALLDFESPRSLWRHDPLYRRLEHARFAERQDE